MWYVQNPWKEVAQEERKRVSLYFAAARYETALQELQRLLSHVESEEREFLHAMASAIEGYRDWDNFRHRDAKPKLGKALSFLKPYARGVRREGLARVVLEMEANLEFLNRLTAAETRDEAYILDLIANADRRASIEGKYEDAVARLYSCLERGAKFRLQRQFGISTEAGRSEQIPETLRAEFEQRYTDVHDGGIKLPLFAAYRLLDALDDHLGHRFVGQQDGILQLLSLRNLSPLGHGEQPVGADGYTRFRCLLVELLGVDESSLPRFPMLQV